MVEHDQDRQHQPTRVRVVLVLENAGDEHSADARLRRIVKAMLRAHGYRLVSIRDQEQRTEG